MDQNAPDLGSKNLKDKMPRINGPKLKEQRKKKD